jgi:formylglycine-generating enzyme required for sulfatase activity
MKPFVLLCWLCAAAALGQEIIVQGTVVNQYNTMVPSCLVEWKLAGTVARLDSNGVFRIPLSGSTGDTLRVSAYGYIDTVLAKSSVNSPLSITLHPVASRLQIAAQDIPKGMKPITGGTFQMDRDGAVPKNTVRVSSFWMDSVEVLAADYDTLMRRYSWYNGLDSGNSIAPGMPLSSETWFMAVLYCNARSLRDGLDTVYSYRLSLSNGTIVITNVVAHFEEKGYRLPTEAEWEFASRGLVSAYYYWGNTAAVQTVSLYAVYSGNATGVNKVATKIPNMFGLYDMVGNVWERTTNSKGNYPDSVLHDPVGTQGTYSNTIRGCAWNSPISDPPTCGNAAVSIHVVAYETGFRLVLRDTVHIPALPDPHQVMVPDAPICSGLLDAGLPVTFKQPGLALCTKGHAVEFRIAWGDGDTSRWLTGAVHEHTYRDSGIYYSTVQARCTVDTSLLSGFSRPARIAIAGPHFVKPSPAVSGPLQGKKGSSYQFAVQPSLCNKGHAVKFYYAWGDGFFKVDPTLPAVHSWSRAGDFSVSVYARCSTGVTSDTSRMTIAIADTAIPFYEGGYRSGTITFYRMSAEPETLKIDLSDSLGTQYDVIVTGFGWGSNVLNTHMPYGFYNLGSVNVSDTSKAKIDTLVACMQITAPENGFECCSIATETEFNFNNISGYDMLVVKTSEGHYGLLFLSTFYIGDIASYQYYWGYQSGGSRCFSPDIKCDIASMQTGGAITAPQHISATYSKNALTIALPGAHPFGVVSLYDIRGRLVRRHYLAASPLSRIDLSKASAGSYLLKVVAGNQEYVCRFVRTR